LIKPGSLFFILILAGIGKLFAQSPTQAEVVPFTEFLIENGNLHEAIRFVNPILETEIPSKSARDSLIFLKATAFDKLKNDSLARVLFLQVSEESSLFVRSRFLVVQRLISSSKFLEALNVVKTIPETDSEYSNEVRAYLWLGLQRYTNSQENPADIPKEEKLASGPLKKEYTAIKWYSDERKQLKKKSPFIAGLLSALVPGLGKIYAGSIPQGIASFIRIGILGGIATELFLRQGYKDPQFIFFGGVAAAYYVGGIYGSVYLPKLNYNEKLESLNHNVKISLSIPF
jgi:hypothetical protein